MAYVWNLKRVHANCTDLERSVRGNELKAFSDAGGLRFWHGYRVNSYCRIKVPGLNVTFDCCIRARTDVPEFQLLCYQWDLAPPNESVHLVHLRDGCPVVH